MRPKAVGKLLHSNDLSVPKDLNHIFTNDPVPKLPSATQFLICHLQEKGERCLVAVFSGHLIAFSNFRGRKAKCFEAPTWNAHTDWNTVPSSNTRFITASPQSYCRVLPGSLASYADDPNFYRYSQIKGKKFSLDYSISKVIKQEQRL